MSGTYWVVVDYDGTEMCSGLGPIPRPGDILILEGHKQWIVEQLEWRETPDCGYRVRVYAARAEGG